MRASAQTIAVPYSQFNVSSPRAGWLDIEQPLVRPNVLL